MARREAGNASLAVGILAGIIGLAIYAQVECFFTCYRPHETLGLLVVGFGMVLFVLGIVLLATARRNS